MKAVLISINPKWCELIASGKKTIEVRKTKPNIEAPFKCYIYMTKKFYRKGDGYFQGRCCGKVIGEFVCDCFTDKYFELIEKTCLNLEELHKYANGGNIYGWHISDLKIYDEPKELSEFCFTNSVKGRWDKNGCRDMVVRKPPQSWCYVEEI